MTSIVPLDYTITFASSSKSHFQLSLDMLATEIYVCMFLTGNVASVGFYWEAALLIFLRALVL
jgi:hypothetical protein